MSKPVFIWCRSLIVYNDFGFSDNSKFGKFGKSHISNCECKRFMDGKPCNNRGRCIIARENDAWKQVSSKSWGDK